jgi:hypothetical protein
MAEALKYDEECRPGSYRYRSLKRGTIILRYTQHAHIGADILLSGARPANRGDLNENNR